MYISPMTNTAAQKRARNLCRSFAMVIAIAISLIFPINRAIAEQTVKRSLKLNQISPQLRPYAIAVGSRLYRDGKERLTANAKLSLEAKSAESVKIVWQNPLTIMLDDGKNPILYDRSNSPEEVIGDRNAATVIQTLLEDSLEGFVALERNCIAKYHLGYGFILKGSEVSNAAADIIEMTYRDLFHNGQPIMKTYYFDSKTKLLGMIKYKNSSGSSVHVLISDWRKINSEMIPFRIERWDDDTRTMELAIESVNISAIAAEDFGGGE